MSSSLQDYLEGNIDFTGQKLVDQISKVTLAGAAVIAFIVGFVMQDLRLTFAIMGFATLVLALVVLPPWPMFNQHPVKWLPSSSEANKPSKTE